MTTKSKLVELTVGVDAGCFAVCDASFIEDYGGEAVVDCLDSHVLKMEPGKYKVHLEIEDTWRGPLDQTFDIELRSGKVIVSDLCYMIKDPDTWDKLLRETNYLQNLVSPKCHVVETGGDGGFFTKIEFTRRET